MATQRFWIIFTPGPLGKWSNLTNIFFKWVGSTNHQLFEKCHFWKVNLMDYCFWVDWNKDKCMWGKLSCIQLEVERFRLPKCQPNQLPLLATCFFFEGLDSLAVGCVGAYETNGSFDLTTVNGHQQPQLQEAKLKTCNIQILFASVVVLKHISFLPLPGKMIKFDNIFFANGLVQPPTSYTS